MSVDIGKVRDNGAISVLDTEYLVVHAERIPIGTSYELQALRASELCRRWGAQCCIDVTGVGAGGHALGSDSIIKLYRDKISNLREIAWNTSSKEKMVQALSVNIEQHRLKIPSQFSELIHELNVYEYSYRNGLYRYSAPSGQRDDLTSSLMMANLCAKNNWVSTGGSPLSMAYA